MITSFQDLILAFGRIIGLIIPLTVGIALVYFFWGIVQFIGNSGDEKGVTEGKSKMIWGIVVLFIMTSVWGIVSFIQGNLFGFTNSPSIAPSPNGQYNSNGDPCNPYDWGTPQCSYDQNGNPVSIPVTNQTPNSPGSNLPIKSRSINP